MHKKYVIVSNYYLLFMFHNKLQVKHITFLANKSKKLFSIIVVIVWIIIVVGAITSIIVVVTSIAIRIIWIWKCKGIINSMDSRGIRQFFIQLIKYPKFQNIMFYKKYKINIKVQLNVLQKQCECKHLTPYSYSTSDQWLVL